MTDTSTSGRSNLVLVAGTILATLAIRRHSHFDLLSRVWELRENLTAYDAMYVALAEATDATLVTCDARLGGAPGQDASIEVVR